MENHMNTRAFSVAILAAVLAACNTVPERNNMLEQARSHLGTVQQDTQVTGLAPDELKRATDAFARADEAQKKGEPAATVDHLSYLADRRVTMAQETATSRSAQAVVAGASAERDKLRLANRTQEVDVAQGKLALAQQANVQQRSELDQAQSDATRGGERINALEQQLSALGAKKTDHGMVVTLGGVLFYTGQARLLPNAQVDMAKLADFFKRNPRRTALIEGNTDSVGGGNANMNLSQQRADAVRDALVALGVSADRLRTSANGEDKPVATNATAAGRQMNRRVEVIFAPQSDDVSVN
jgi:outer membrane protein OmpA-like peptidoglycan-associated protein